MAELLVGDSLPFQAKHLQRQCVSCEDNVDVLRCLPCLHSVSVCDQKECHESLSKRKVICILCQETFPTPAEGFPRYLRAEKIVANQQQQKEETCSGEHETPQKASVYCFACPGPLCEACHDFHKRAAFLKKHKVVSLEDTENEKEGIIHPANVFCSTHKRALEFFCCDCEVVVCALCHVGEHQSHRVQLVDKDAEEANRQSLLQCVSSAKSRMQKITSTVHDIDGRLVSLQQESQRCKQDIAELRVDMMQAVDTRCAHLVTEVEENDHQKRTELEQHKKSLQHQSKQLELFLASTEEALNHGATVEQLSLRKAVIQRASALMSLPVLPASASSGLKLVSEKKEEVKTCLSGMGRVCLGPHPESSTMEGLPVSDNTVHCNPWSFPLKLTVVSRDSNGEQCTTGGGRVDPLLVPTTCGVPVRGEVEDRGDGTYQVIFRYAPSQECRLSVTMNGRQVRGSPLSVSVHTEVKLEFGKSHNEYQQVPALTWTRQNTLVAISSNPCYLRYYSTTGEELRSIDLHSKDICAVGVATLSNGSTAVSFCNSNKIVTYQANAYILSPADLKGPRGLAVNSKDELFVAEYSSHRLSVFSPTSGDRMYSFGSIGSGPGQFNGPDQICIGQDNLVYVSDKGNNRVQVFHQDGRFIRQFGQNVLNSPAGLGLIKDGHLVVASEHTWVISTVPSKRISKLSIFTLTGECVHEMQNIGLNRPYGVAVDNKGFIYVADSGRIVKI